MANSNNIMALTQVRNNVTRSGFDLSRSFNFTAKAGELLPVCCLPILPDDDVNFSLQSFARTQPLNSSAFARMRGYFNFYFVDMHLLWNKFPTSITQMRTNLQHASGPVLSDNVPLPTDLPYITSQQIAEYVTSLGTDTNQFGFSRALATCKLLEYLGYGDFYWYCDGDIPLVPGNPGAGTVGQFKRPDGKNLGGYTWATAKPYENLKYSVFPLMSYQKVYADYFRYTQWERTNPSTFNLDYLDGGSSFNLDLAVSGFVDSFNFMDMRFANWQRDLLHGVIPQAQYGEAAVVNVATETSLSTATLSVQSKSGTGIDTSANGNNLTTVLGLVGVYDDKFTAGSAGTGVESQASIRNFKLTLPPGTNLGSLSVLALRRAEAAQKWKEIALSAEEDYPSQMMAHWNAKANPYTSHMCSYLGGAVLDLSINEVVNTNLVDNAAPDIKGKGTMSGNGEFTFHSEAAYGFIIGVFHVLPQIDYVTSAPDFSTLLTDVLQFPIPEFDQIGMEAVPAIRGLNPVSVQQLNVPRNLYFGYAPEYIDWKTALDRSVGDFRFSLNNWIIGYSDADLMANTSVDYPDNPNVEADSVKAGFFKVSPSCLDDIFSVRAGSFVNTDSFLIRNYFNINVVRSLDTNGLPY